MRRRPRRLLPRALLAACLVGPLAAPPSTALAQGRYQAQGAAQRHFQEGEEAITRGERAREEGEREEADDAFRDAIAAFRKAIDVDPDYVDAYARLGRLYYDLDRPADAIPVLEAGRARAPDSEDVRFWLGQHLLRAGKMNGARPEAAARIDEAVGLLEAVARSTDRFPEVHLVLANHFYDAGRFDAAADAYTRYLEERPDAIQARARLGNAYIRQKQFDRALAAFERVRQADPDNVPVLVNIGTAHLRLAQFDEAARTMQAALERDPERGTARFGLAYAHFAAQRPAEAIPHFERFVQKVPDSFNGRYFGGSALMAAGRDAQALPELRRAAALRPDVAQPQYKIGIIHLRNGRSDEAVAALEKARALRPDDPWVLSALGTAARQQGRFVEALALNRQAAAIGSKTEQGARLGRLRAALARTAEAAGEDAEARRAIEGALEVGGDDPWVKSAALAILTRLAKARAAEGQAEPALALWRQALAVAPEDPDLEAGLASLLAATGQGAEALRTAQSIPARDRPAVKAATARAMLAAGQHAEAARAYAALADEMPALAAAGEGAALLAADRLDEAVARLDAAREAGRDGPGLRRNQGLAHLRRAARALDRRLEAAGDVQAAVAADAHLDPLDVARAHYAALILALRRGRDAEAEAHLARMTRAVREAPEGSRLAGDVHARGLGARHVDLLTAYVNVLRGRDDRAVDVLDGLREARRGNTEAGQLMRLAQHRLGRAAIDRGDLRAGRKHLEAAKALGETPTLRHDIAVLDWLAGRKGNALELWARQADRGLREARFNEAVALEAAGRHEAAYRAFVQAAKAGGPQAQKAAEIADAKRRVFGFAEGGE